jgi:uncharacterized membrane protein YhaH (DUF805 family)
MTKSAKKLPIFLYAIFILTIILFEIYIITDCVFYNQCFTRRTHYATPSDSTYWVVIIVHGILLVCILFCTIFLIVKRFLKIRKVRIMRKKYFLSKYRSKKQ